MKNHEADNKENPTLNNSFEEHDERIVSILVTDETERMKFLPHYLGVLCVHIESYIYKLMRSFSKDYDGGEWGFCRLKKIHCDNFKGFYMRPPEGKYQFSCSGNYFDGELSADTAGIVVTLYALNIFIACIYCKHDAFKTFIDKLPTLQKLYDALYEFAREHAEWKLIRAAID